jgi:dTMP kinase
MDQEPDLNFLRGKFIVFDGPDGCGKSTLIEEFRRRAEEQGVPAVTTREPGGTHYGEKIREVLLTPSEHKLEPEAEMLLFMAARAQLMREQIVPALNEGNLVLADRFVSSSLAYQGEGEGIPWQTIVGTAKEVIPYSYWPDMTVLLHVSETTAAERKAKKSQFNPDQIEKRSEEFRRRVRLGYVKQAAMYQQYCELIEADGPVEDVADLAARRLRERLDLSDQN